MAAPAEAPLDRPATVERLHALDSAGLLPEGALGPAVDRLHPPPTPAAWASFVYRTAAGLDRKSVV